MGKPSNSLTVEALPSTLKGAPFPSRPPIEESPTSSTLFRNPSSRSVNTTHSQPPPPYTRPPRPSATSPSRSNIASQLNAASTAGRPRPAMNERRIALGLRLLCVAAGLLGIMFYALAMSKEDKVYSEHLSMGVEIFGMSALCGSTFEACIILITDLILLHRKKYPMHPAIPLSFDLLAWLALLSMAIIACSWMPYGYSSVCNDSPDQDCKDWSGFVGRMDNAGLGLVFVAMILHFIIFVRACRAVDRQRKEIKEMKATLRADVEMR